MNTNITKNRLLSSEKSLKEKDFLDPRSREYQEQQASRELKRSTPRPKLIPQGEPWVLTPKQPPSQPKEKTLEQIAQEQARAAKAGALLGGNVCTSVTSTTSGFKSLASVMKLSLAKAPPLPNILLLSEVVKEERCEGYYCTKCDGCVERNEERQKSTSRRGSFRFRSDKKIDLNAIATVPDHLKRTLKELWKRSHLPFLRVKNKTIGGWIDRSERTVSRHIAEFKDLKIIERYGCNGRDVLDVLFNPSLWVGEVGQYMFEMILTEAQKFFLLHPNFGILLTRAKAEELYNSMAPPAPA